MLMIRFNTNKWLQCRLLAFPRVGLNNGAIRSKSDLPQQQNPKRMVPSAGEWKHLRQHIPGEAVQENKLTDRVPMFPLIKETVPTLLPRPGVPQVGKQHTFRQVVQILKAKTKPELVYEAEPHRLYFLVCFAGCLMFTVYGLLLGEYAWYQAKQDYEDNVKEQTGPVRNREWAFSLIKHGSYSAGMFTMAILLARLPTRLIRRMWYLPGPVEHIKFTLYPLLPGRPSPVVTVPLSQLSRRSKSRVWTGKGFYGTADLAMFFFMLREAGPPSKLWLIDRKGFFWLDGRVFDYLFGNESLAEAEAGVPYDEQIGIMNREVRRQKQKLREKHGRFYMWKWGSQEVKRDINRAKNYTQRLSGGKKELGSGKGGK